MNLIQFAGDIEKILQQSCQSYERMGDPDQDGAAWFYNMEDDICGFISCESNSEDMRIPTVSIALSLGDVSTASHEEILALLGKNKELFTGSLNVTAFGESSILSLQTRIAADAYNPHDFLNYFKLLQTEASMFGLQQRPVN
jgi:hypothetical protein